MSENAGYDGWLFKEGSLIKTWKKRFMVLKNNELTYYNSYNITSNNKKGRLTVIGAELSAAIENGLLVHGEGGRILKIYAANETERDAWFEALANVSNTIDEHDNTRPSLSVNATTFDKQLSCRSSLSNGVYANNDTTCSGWLSKQGRVIKNWKRRYFLLRGRNLAYFSTSDTGGNAKGIGYLTGVSLMPSIPFSLSIQLDNSRILHVSADSLFEMKKWYDALCQILNSSPTQADVVPDPKRGSLQYAKRSSSGELPKHRICTKSNESGRYSKQVQPVRKYEDDYTF